MKQIEVRQAIRTKYISPTNTKGSRVRASYAGGSIIVGWQCDLNVEENHLFAANQLSKKLGWGKIKSGCGF